MSSWTWKRILMLVAGTLLLIGSLNSLLLDKPCTGTREFCLGALFGYITGEIVGVVGGIALLIMGAKGSQKKNR